MKRIILLCALLSVISFSAAVPAQINYQGKITNSAGVALEGTYDMTFRLYDVPTGGTALWSEPHSSVGVHRGLFDVVLGETNPIDLPFDEQYYLEIEIGGEVLSPRIPLTSVGYSFRAAVADSAAAVNLDTLGAYSDTSHTHSLVLTGDITAAGAVPGTLSTDISAGAVDWDELSSAVQDSIHGDWVQLSPSSAQTDPDATPAIYINKTGVGQLLVLQKDGTDRITISNSGNEFAMVGPGDTKSIISDSALAISANKGATFTIDADNTSSTVSLRILHDYGDTLFWISEANYVGIAPRDGEPSATPRGGLYVDGNSSGTDTLFFYDGAGWKPLMTSDMVSGSFILNQYSSEQSANFLISGKGHIHNTADSDTAFVSREGGAGGIGGYFRGGSGSGAVALIAERPTENNRAELANADAGVYGEVDGSDESAVIGHNIASSGTDSAKGVLGVADGAGGTIHIGVQGTASGAAENYGGFFSPMLGIAPQTSLPAGANGGLCVKDGSPDSLFFYDGTTWTPIKTGYESVQWEQAGSSPNRYKRPVFDGAGNDNVRVYEVTALRGVYGRSYQDASNYALGYLGYYGSDIGGVSRFIGVYGNSGSGTDNVAVAGRYDANNYGYVGGNGIGVAGYGTTYGVYGQYNSTTYGFIGGQVAGNDVAVHGNGTWASGFFGDYDDSECGERGIYAIGTIYGVFARDTTGGVTSADNFAYLGYRDPNPPNYRYGIYASGLDYAGYFLGNVKIDASSGNDTRVYINRQSTSEEASIRFQTADGDDWFLGLDDPVSGYENFQLYNYDAGAYVVTVENGTGNVGIGTTSPAAKLDVNGTVRAAHYRDSGGGNLIRSSDGSINVSEDSDGSWDLTVAGGGGGTPGGSDGQIQYNDGGVFGGAADFYYDDATNRVGIGTSSPGARLDVNTPSAGGTHYCIRASESGSGTGYAIFATATGSGTCIGLYATATGSGDNYAAIFDNGNVGIGTTSPGYKLHIVGGDVKIGNSAGDNRKLYFGDGSYVYIGEGPTDDGLYLYGRDRISLMGGNVGVGTTSPAAKLDVNGTVRAAHYRDSGGGDLIRSSDGSINVTEDSDGSWNLTVAGGGGGTPGGSDGDVQFNDGGSFGGDGAFVWDKSDSTLIIKAASVGDGLRIEGDTYGCPVIILKNTNTHGSMAYGFGTSGDTYYAGVEFEIDSSGTEVNKMVLYNNNPGAIEFVINPGGGAQTLMRMPPDASKVSMLKPLSLEYSRTYVMGYDGGGNHWITTGGSEPGSCYMSFIGTSGGNATAVNIAPGGGTGLYVNSSGNVGIGTSSPTSKLYVDGDIYCTGKITSEGGYDPPYVGFSMETRKSICERVKREVPPEKLEQAIVFWNSETQRMEVYLPTKGEFRDFMGNLLERGEEYIIK